MNGAVSQLLPEGITVQIVKPKRFKGRVISFHLSKGFGFIWPDQGPREVFVRYEQILSSPKNLREGEQVEFEMEEGRRGPEAKRVYRLTSREEDG